MADIKRASHGCSTKHRTHLATAKCTWPRAEWVVGSGPYAVLAHCRVLTVTLHPTLERAQAAKQIIDSTACGGMCHGRHELLEVVLP